MNFNTSKKLTSIGNTVSLLGKDISNVLKDNNFKQNYSAYENIDYNAEFKKLSDKEIGTIGDINRDGVIDSKDTNAISKYLSGNDRYNTNIENMLKSNGLYCNPNSCLYNWMKKNKDFSYLDEVLRYAKNGGTPDDPFTIMDTYSYGELTSEEKKMIREDYEKKLQLIEECRNIILEDKSYKQNYDLDYDMNGDGIVNIMDVSTLQKYIELEHNNAMTENPDNSMVSTTGKFSEFTDYQNVALNALQTLPSSIKEKYSNVTFSELCELLKSDGYDSESIKKFFVDNGFGDCKIVEFVNDGSFDAVVLQDVDGNYRIFYFGTDPSQQGDLLYDARNILRDQLDSSYTRTGATAASGLLGALGGALLGFAIGGPVGAAIGAGSGGVVGSGGVNIAYEVFSNKIEEEYDAQQAAAKSLANRYYEIAQKEGKHLSFQGYSLGGSLAEEAYLDICDKEGAQDVLDGVILFNPYHDNLNSTDVYKLKSAKGFELYCAEGDMVSTVFNHDDFDDVAQYLYMDIDPLIAKSKEESGNYEIFGVDVTDVMAIFGRTHAIEPYIQDDFVGTHNKIAFAADGSVKTAVTIKDSLTGEDIPYIVHGRTFSELMYKIYGKKISNIDEFAGFVLSGGK